MSDTISSNEIVFSEGEISALLRTPAAIQLVIDHHHQQEAEADAIGEPELQGCVRFSENRRKVLEARRDALLVENGDKPGDMLIVNGYERAAHEPMQTASEDPSCLSRAMFLRRYMLRQGIEFARTEEEKQLFDIVLFLEKLAAHEPEVSDDLYALLVRRGYAQHEAHEIANMTARVEAGQPALPPSNVLTEEQRSALGYLLEAAQVRDWSYFMPGATAGDQLYPLAGEYAPTGPTKGDAT